MLCKECNGIFRGNRRKFCSQRCYWKSMAGIKGEDAPNYRKVVGKSQVHKWLDVNYGKPFRCENKKCEHRSIWFDWALKTGKQYERNRDNFLRLCRSCHRRYDLTPEKKKQAMKNLWWKKGVENPGRGAFIKKGEILNPIGKNQHTKSYGK